jgi:hypothetical protein
VPSNVRQVAGLALKTEIDKNFPMLSNETLDYVKQKLLVAFYDPSPNVRRSVSSTMSTMLVKGGFYFWKELVPFLTGNLSDPAVVENSIAALAIIIEDTYMLLEDEKFHKMIEDLGTAIFRLLGTPQQLESVLINSLNTVNILLSCAAPFIEQNMEAYMKHIISMIPSASSSVRKRILQGLVNIIDIQANMILKEDNFPSVASLMLDCLRIKDDERVATEACQFWSSLASNGDYDENPELRETQLRRCLPQLLPALMEACLLTDHDKIGRIASKEEDAYEDRKPEGIKKEDADDAEEAEEDY